MLMGSIRPVRRQVKKGQSGEPYRLWNLDVFQFELDERMALYGGIPFVASHTPEGTAGALWLNSAETWVDVGYRNSYLDNLFMMTCMISRDISSYNKKWVKKILTIMPLSLF